MLQHCPHYTRDRLGVLREDVETAWHARERCANIHLGATPRAGIVGMDLEPTLRVRGCGRTQGLGPRQRIGLALNLGRVNATGSPRTNLTEDIHDAGLVVLASVGLARAAERRSRALPALAQVSGSAATAVASLLALAILAVTTTALHIVAALIHLEDLDGGCFVCVRVCACVCGEVRVCGVLRELAEGRLVRASQAFALRLAGIAASGFLGQLANSCAWPEQGRLQTQT